MRCTSLYFLIGVLLLLLDSPVSAFTDFYGMSPPPTRQILSDGTVHIAHDVHHTFPEHGTFFKASYTAHHDSKWHFVELSALVPDLSTMMKCSPSDETQLVLLNPSPQLLSELQKQEMAHTVVTAHPRHHCGGKGIFRQLTGMKVEDNRLTLQTVPLNYHHIFRNLKFRLETNHVHQSHASTSEPTRVSSNGPAYSGRNFEAQSFLSFFKHIGEDLVHGAEDVFHAVEDVGRDVFDAAGTIIELASGNYDHQTTFPLPGVNWDPNFSTGGWDVIETSAQLAVSINFQPSISIVLDIADYRLLTFETYFTGSFSGAFRGAFYPFLGGGSSSSSPIHAAWTQTITTIGLSPLTFMLGPVPIILKPTIPIQVGAQVAVTPHTDITAVVTADATILYGISWNAGVGYRLLKQDGFSHSYDFTPKPMQSQFSANPFIQPVFALSIDFIGKVGVASRLGAQMIVQPNADCAQELTVNMVPAISVYAGLDIDIFNIDIWSWNFGPYTLWSTTFPLVSYCVPGFDQSASSGSISGSDVAASTSDDSSIAISTSGSSAAGRGFALQQEQENPQLVITRTTHKRLGPGFDGKAWHGHSRCGDTPVNMTYSMQYAADPAGGNIIVLTITHTLEPTAFALLQAAYRSEGAAPHVGQRAIYSLVTAAPYYSASSNETILNLTAPDQIEILVSLLDTRHITLDSDVTCGSVSLSSPASTNDTRVFRLLSAAEAASTVNAKARAESQGKPVVVIAVGATSGILLVAAVALGVAMKTRNRSSTRSKSSATSAEMDTLEHPLVGEQAHHEEEHERDQPAPSGEGELHGESTTTEA